MNTRTMRQPRKDVLRDQLALAADEIIWLREEVDSNRWYWPQFCFGFGIGAGVSAAVFIGFAWAL